MSNQINSKLVTSDWVQLRSCLTDAVMMHEVFVLACVCVCAACVCVCVCSLCIGGWGGLNIMQLCICTGVLEMRFD